MTKEEYLNTLDGWAAYYGFNKEIIEQGLEVDRMYKRSVNKVSKFGRVDTFGYVKFVPDDITPQFAESYSYNLFLYSMRVRTGPPLGFGAMLEVRPLLVVNNISKELYEFINNYCPKHMMASEFPSILDFNSGNLYYYPTTPVWGALYYENYRNETNYLYSPISWKNVSVGKSL